jgi:hypothetical protein
LKIVRQLAWSSEQDGDRLEELGVPVEKRIEGIDPDAPQRAAVVDRMLATGGAVLAGERRVTVLAVRERLGRFSALAEKAAFAACAERVGSGIAKDVLRRFVGHRRNVTRKQRPAAMSLQRRPDAMDVIVIFERLQELAGFRTFFIG